MTQASIVTDDQRLRLFSEAALLILQAYSGRATIVALSSGDRIECANIGWGRDFGEMYDHVYSNVSPPIPALPIAMFSTSDIVAIIDKATGAEILRRV